MRSWVQSPSAAPVQFASPDSRRAATNIRLRINKANQVFYIDKNSFALD
jgi:hypothetical protein